MPTDQIANTMKLAIVSIEDKRFAEHNGVDWKGTLTGSAGYMSRQHRHPRRLHHRAAVREELPAAGDRADRRGEARAVETTPARKLREIRMALTLDKTFTKPEILTRYLNLSFGNNAFGVQDAAQTYFGINASELNWEQAALLAGLVQSTSSLNPYTNPEGALARRNVVLDTMIENLPSEAEALRAAKQQPLGILPQPQELPRGCIAAGDRAFFCDYALEYLARAGISKEQVAKGGYLIKTTLDPDVQAPPVKSAIDGIASPDLDGIASVMSVVRPGKESHPVLAMASNRTYGLNTEPAKPCSRSRSHWSATAQARSSRSSRWPRRWTWGWASCPAGCCPTVPGEGPRQQRHPWLSQGNLVRAERRQLPRVDEHHRRAGHLAEHRVRQADLPDRGATRRGHGGPARPAVLRASGNRTRLRPGKQREPGRLHQTPEHRLVHAGPVRVECVGIVQRRRDAGVGRHVVPTNPIDKVFDRTGTEVAVTTETCTRRCPRGWRTPWPMH